MNAQDEQNVINQAIEILEARLQKPKQALCSPQDTFNYLKLKLSELEHEVFSILFLDNQNRVLTSTELFRGTIDGAAVYPREVVKAALQFNAAAVIFAHNHPSGVSEPSTADRHITERLKTALQTVDIRTLDHVIVGSGNAYSFAEHGLL